MFDGPLSFTVKLKWGPWSSLELSLTLLVNRQFLFNHSRVDFAVVQPPNLPANVSLSLSLTHTNTHTCTHRHVFLPQVRLLITDCSILAGFVTHASAFFSCSIFLFPWVRLRGSSQEAGKVGCWCGSAGRRPLRCRGSCWGASRSEPCRRPSPSALEPAHTVVVPTEEGRKMKFALVCASQRCSLFIMHARNCW